jgi:hypothetical protein
LGWRSCNCRSAGMASVPSAPPSSGYFFAASYISS